MTGVLIADYYLVRHRELHLGDLYVGNSTSAYWYIAGFNWRAITSWSVCLIGSSLSIYTISLENEFVLT